MSWECVVFFFQAEDGIRDDLVTGVQTCALPILAVRARAQAGAAVVYTTHYLPELADLGATLAVARAGRVIARGAQHSLISGLPAELGEPFAHPPPKPPPPTLPPPLAPPPHNPPSRSPTTPP